MRAKKLISASVSIVMLISVFSVNAFSASPKSGGTCTKIGKKQDSGGRTFTCISKNGKLMWNKGTQVKTSTTLLPLPTPSPSASASPTPSPIQNVTPSPSPSLTPTPDPTPLTPSDSLNFKGPMIYGISKSMLTRLSDSGYVFESDSRETSQFSEVRQKAFSELNKNPRDNSHPNVELIYEIRPEFPEFLIEHTKRELDEAAALWDDMFDRKIKVKVFLITEKDREWIKGNRWLAMNLPATFTRFDLKLERPFISGGGGYWNEDGEWSGNIFLATASYLNLNYVNYEWPQVAKHEFVHVVQNYAFYGGTTYRPWDVFQKTQPQHFREGAANTISYLTSFRNIGWTSDAMDWLVWRRAKNETNWMQVNSEADAIKMMRATESSQPTSAFEMSYAIGAIMHEWFISEYGLNGFKKLLKSMSSSSSFDQALKLSVGIDQETFYNRVAPYVVSVFNRVSPY